MRQRQVPWHASSYRQHYPVRAQPKLIDKTVGDPENNLRYFDPLDRTWKVNTGFGGETELTRYEDRSCGRCGVMQCACRPLCDMHAPEQLISPRMHNEMKCAACEEASAYRPQLPALQPIQLRDKDITRMHDAEIWRQVGTFAKLHALTLECRAGQLPVEDEMRLCTTIAGKEWCALIPMFWARRQHIASEPWLGEIAKRLRAARDEADAKLAIDRGYCPLCMTRFDCLAHAGCPCCAPTRISRAAKALEQAVELTR